MEKTLSDVARLFATRQRVEFVEKVLADRKENRIRFKGLAGSALAMLLSGVNPGRPALVVADDADTAGYLYNDLCQILPVGRAMIFPSGYRRDIKYGQSDEPARILRTETLAALSLTKCAPDWVVTYPEALAEGVPGKTPLSTSTIVLETGQKSDMGQVVARLLELGFRTVEYVYEPGQFARRGSILDIYSYATELPYRIDFFDDEIDSIRLFDIETQLSEKKTDSARILPSEAMMQSEKGKISLLEFMGADTPVFCQSLDHIFSRVRAIACETPADAVAISGEGDTHALDNVVDPDRFEQTSLDMQLIEFGQGADSFETTVRIDFETSPQSLYHKNFELIADSFGRFLKDGYEIFILSDSAYQTQRLKTIFEDRHDDIVFTPVERTLHEGFSDRVLKKCYFTDHQIFDRFHKYTLRDQRARNGKLALSLKELGQIETGDYIVHVDHGVGRFGGLVKTAVNGRPQEMIKLIYQNDDIILVSIHALHKLSKYRGKDGLPPRINKLGSGAWEKLKDKTKKKVKDIARDLIKLYAARREQKGYAFSPDSYVQHELEAGFMYEDTPDQLKATQAVKADMESERPMDRLICGDVGFGKTEIAVRAAVKAAVDGKQTAVLVPTTVLAMQHYRTFTERLRDLPVRVDFLSRARKAKDVKQILADLEAGKIDILIGTHKLIGKGVKFHDLGLLIIDEEQKFGVVVKEKLKQMKVNVDTLTMSATPIPRTLQFSLMGARDMSSLNTPPANRHPIQTSVVSAADEIVAEAVGFELSRQGQVFVVSPRIADLDALEAQLRRVVPGARIVKAHGQMPAERLEQAIMDFTAHEYDILLSTTIVENGIDIPNVNTIIINNAHNFGLSELHQLRGRVGRSSRKAFCYLMVPPGNPLTPEARRRLQAIESFSDLGAGIHIAMQDLDIRGAGNLLGAEQSGFIADLGYETYQKILKESVTELKTEEFGETFADVNGGEEDEFVADCVVESDLELRLPPVYVPQESERIMLYQRLDNMTTEMETEIFRQQLEDRFGRIPEVTEQLIKVVPMRLLARRLGIERVVLKEGKMRLYFVGDDNKAYYRSNSFGKVLAFVQTAPRRCVLREANGRRSILIHKVPDVTEALNVLQTMTALSPV